MQTPEPIADRRLSGDHWWDPDRINHVNDLPQFCPGCGAGLDTPGSMSVEYWNGDKRVYHTNCEACAWSGDIARVERLVGPETPH